MNSSAPNTAETSGFPGRAKLVVALDRAMQKPDTPAVTEAVKHTLSGLIGTGDFELPSKCFQTSSEHYLRHELYESDRYDYSIVAMSWAPKQGTPLHDHAGLWCVEGVCRGALEVSQYELIERGQHDLCRFEHRADHRARTGTAGSLIPPYEYHRIVNASAETPAVSLHIYQRRMTECNAFEPLDDNWFRRETQPLCSDS
jgi:predicted metal-dependent enzyme (double-stranded beta helix superfamily)